MAPSKFQVYGLDEIYPELGSYSFKIVLSPRYYKTGQDFDVCVIDSDRKSVQAELKHWGRKLNVSFLITDQTADGVASVIISRNGQETGRFHFWVIKP